VGFPFPIAVTGLHMIINGGNTWLLCRALGLPVGRSAGVTPAVFARHFLAVGLFTGVDIALSNTSFIYLEASFVEMVKSSTPIWTLLLSVGLGLQRPSYALTACVLVMVAGQVAITHGEAAFDALGFGIVLTAAVGAAIRITLMQRLMLVRFPTQEEGHHSERQQERQEEQEELRDQPSDDELLGGESPAERNQGETMSSFQAMAHVFPVSALVMVLALPVRYKERGAVCRDYPSYCLEDVSPDARYYSELEMLLHGSQGAGRPSTGGVLLLSCGGAVLALALNGLEFVVVHRSSALTYTVMGILKIILVFVAAALIFGNEITRLQIFGVVLSTCGMLAYNLVKLLGAGTEAGPGRPAGSVDGVTDHEPLVRNQSGGGAEHVYVLESVASDEYLDGVPHEGVPQRRVSSPKSPQHGRQ